MAVDWDSTEPLDIAIDALRDGAVPGASFAELPGPATNAKQYTAWQREFKRWIRQNETVILYRNKRFRLTSTAGESEGDFRVRLQALASEKRDQAIAINKEVTEAFDAVIYSISDRLKNVQKYGDLSALMDIMFKRDLAENQRANAYFTYGQAIK